MQFPGNRIHLSPLQASNSASPFPELMGIVVQPFCKRSLPSLAPNSCVANVEPQPQPAGRRLKAAERNRNCSMPETPFSDTYLFDSKGLASSGLRMRLPSNPRSARVPRSKESSTHAPLREEATKTAKNSRPGDPGVTSRRSDSAGREASLLLQAKAPGAEGAKPGRWVANAGVGRGAGNREVR